MQYIAGKALFKCAPQPGAAHLACHFVTSGALLLSSGSAWPLSCCRYECTLHLLAESHCTEWASRAIEVWAIQVVPMQAGQNRCKALPIPLLPLACHAGKSTCKLCQPHPNPSQSCQTRINQVLNIDSRFAVEYQPCQGMLLTAVIVMSNVHQLSPKKHRLSMQKLIQSSGVAWLFMACF